MDMYVPTPVSLLPEHTFPQLITDNHFNFFTFLSKGQHLVRFMPARFRFLTENRELTGEIISFFKHSVFSFYKTNGKNTDISSTADVPECQFPYSSSYICTTDSKSLILKCYTFLGVHQQMKCNLCSKKCTAKHMNTI